MGVGDSGKQGQRNRPCKPRPGRKPRATESQKAAEAGFVPGEFYDVSQASHGQSQGARGKETDMWSGRFVISSSAGQ